MNPITEALQYISQGNPHMAREVLTPLIDPNTDFGFTIARAANWLDNGLPNHAKDLLEGVRIGEAVGRAMQRRAA